MPLMPTINELKRKYYAAHLGYTEAELARKSLTDLETEFFAGKSGDGSDSVAPRPGSYPPVFLRTGGYWHSMSTTAGNGLNSLGNGTLRLGPVLIPKSINISGLQIDITTAGEAGSVFRFGVYRDNGQFFPGELVSDAGTVSTAAVGAPFIAADINLTPGMYWMGGAVQLAPTTSPAIRITGPMAIPSVPMSTGTPSAGATVIGYLNGGATGALPNPYNGVLGGVAGALPRINFRVA